MKTPTKTPSTVWFSRSRMKLRSTREVYCVDPCASATMVIENTTPATVIIEEAIAESMARDPSASAPNIRGHRRASPSPALASTSTSADASATAASVISIGTNQKLERMLIISHAKVPVRCPRFMLPTPS